jgi:hypothetical protein
MKSMRFCLCLLILGAGLMRAAETTTTLRGKLLVAPGKPAAVETPDHKLVSLDGDESTRQILGDQRLSGFELEAKGHFTGPGRFLIDPIHTRAMLVRQNGRLRMITYFCSTCNIRAYTPGPCACCQRETTLELVDPLKEQP